MARQDDASRYASDVEDLAADQKPNQSIRLAGRVGRGIRNDREVHQAPCRRGEPEGAHGASRPTCQRRQGQQQPRDAPRRETDEMLRLSLQEVHVPILVEFRVQRWTNPAR